MRKTINLAAVFLAGIVLLGGCKKSDAPAAGIPPPLVINASTFRPAFASASPEIQAVAKQVMMNMQGSMYQPALSGLATLAANPALTEPQKKAVSDLTDQLNKKIAAIAAMNAPAK